MSSTLNKKISEEGELLIAGVDGNEVVLIAKSGRNYKLKTETIRKWAANFQVTGSSDVTLMNFVSLNDTAAYRAKLLFYGRHSDYSEQIKLEVDVDMVCNVISTDGFATLKAEVSADDLTAEMVSVTQIATSATRTANSQGASTPSIQQFYAQAETIIWTFGYGNFAITIAIDSVAGTVQVEVTQPAAPSFEWRYTLTEYDNKP